MSAVGTMLVLTTSAQAVYIRHDRSISDYNAIGSRSTFVSSGYLADSRDGFEVGSATLVTPTKVLTAAHVVDGDGDLEVDRPAAFKRWVFGTQTNIPALFAGNVKSVKINPAYKGGKASFDLAIITLKAPVTTVRPAQMSTQNAIGRRGAMVGYGFQGNGKGRSVEGATNKLGAYNEISILQDGTYQTDFDSPAGDKNSFGSKIPLTFEGTTASGDSGSALWAEFGPGSWRIVGVLNGGFNEKGFDSEYGDISIYASLANAKNITFLNNQGLILSGVGTAASTGTAGNTRSPADALPIPEPSATLLALGTLGLLLRERSNPLSRQIH